MIARFLLFILILWPFWAQASTGPKHLISWAAQLYHQAMPFEEQATQNADRQYHEGQKIIFDQAVPLFEKSDIEEWSRDPVIVEKLESTWEMETQFQMELAEDTMLCIDWVEEHLNLSIEKEGDDGYTFMFLGLIEIEEQEDGTFLLSIHPQEDIVHYQFAHEKTQEKYFPGLIVDPEDSEE